MPVVPTTQTPAPGNRGGAPKPQTRGVPIQPPASFPNQGIPSIPNFGNIRPGAGLLQTARDIAKSKETERIQEKQQQFLNRQREQAKQDKRELENEKNQAKVLGESFANVSALIAANRAREEKSVGNIRKAFSQNPETPVDPQIFNLSNKASKILDQLDVRNASSQVEVTSRFINAKTPEEKQAVLDEAIFANNNFLDILNNPSGHLAGFEGPPDRDTLDLMSRAVMVGDILNAITQAEVNATGDVSRLKEKAATIGAQIDADDEITNARAEQIFLGAPNAESIPKQLKSLVGGIEAVLEGKSLDEIKSSNVLNIIAEVMQRSNDPRVEFFNMGSSSIEDLLSGDPDALVTDAGNSQSNLAFTKYLLSYVGPAISAAINPEAIRLSDESRKITTNNEKGEPVTVDVGALVSKEFEGRKLSPELREKLIAFQTQLEIDGSILKSGSGIQEAIARKFDFELARQFFDDLTRIRNENGELTARDIREAIANNPMYSNLGIILPLLEDLRSLVGPNEIQQSFVPELAKASDRNFGNPQDSLGPLNNVEQQPKVLGPVNQR